MKLCARPRWLSKLRLGCGYQHGERLNSCLPTAVRPKLPFSKTEANGSFTQNFGHARQSRPLDSIYPIVYLDCIHVKVRDGSVRVKAVYLAIGLNMAGEKEVFGLWIPQTEGAKFRLQVITELKNRGVHSIFIACDDGLKGLPMPAHLA